MAAHSLDPGDANYYLLQSHFKSVFLVKKKKKNPVLPSQDKKQK